MAIFVCYSRTQFYFAEELSLALSVHGVDTWFDVHRLQPADDWNSEIVAALRASEGVVLVASRAALASPHVRAELDLARELGKPLVVALAERVDLPDSLAGAPRADLCVQFEEQVGRLADALKAGDLGALTARVGASSSSARPAIVWLVLGLLLASALLWEAAVVGMLALGLSAGSAELMLFNLAALAAIGAFCGWLGWAFARRRPGSGTLLGIAFAYGAVLGVIACSLIVYDLVGSALVIEVLEAPVAVVVIWVIAWLGAGAWALQSPSLYRWLPTGDAPRWMRRRMLARRGRGADAQPPPAAGSITYDIRGHELDGAVQRAVDAALQAAGHRRVHGPTADRQILVLSDLTPANGLTHTLKQLGARAVVVISAPISLAALSDAERYQWVDYRRRDRRTLDRMAAAIGGRSAVADLEVVPESLGRRVVPLAVLATATMCVIAAAANLGLGIAGLVGADIYGPAHSVPRSLGALLLGGLALWLAMALAARRLPLGHLLAGVVSVYVVTVATPWLLSPVPWVGWGAVPTALLGLVVILASRKTLADWLPPRALRTSSPTLAAESGAWWRRAAPRSTMVYTAVLTTALLAGLLPVGRTAPLPRSASYTEALQATTRYQNAAFCVETEIERAGRSDYAGPACTPDPTAEWAAARSELERALERVTENGSPAGADAARKVQTALPSSVARARLGDDPTDPDGFFAAYSSFVSVLCRDLNGSDC